MSHEHQLQESCIIRQRNAMESEMQDRLPSKNAHSPNYCSWLAVCANYNANFYCKIALINIFKLYLIKILMVTSKKQTKHKQKQRRMYRSEGHVTASRSPRVTSKCILYKTDIMSWEFCLQDGGVSEGFNTRWRQGIFAYKMAAMQNKT